MSADAFGLLLPDGCRLCDRPLRTWSRVPVCLSCLSRAVRFLPEFFCVSCRTPFLSAAPLDQHGQCRVCRLGLRAFQASFSYGSYEGVLRDLIHLFKYDRIAPLARPLGALLCQGLPLDVPVDVVVPTPLHWWRAAKRGFNQAELLARAVARNRRVPVRMALRRRKATPAQAGLSGAERRENVASAFKVVDRRQIAGRNVLLVDDVLTTGATADACARVLRRAGAARVTVLTLARVDRRIGNAARLDGKFEAVPEFVRREQLS